MIKIITENKFCSLKKLNRHNDIAILNEKTLLKKIRCEDVPFFKELSKYKIEKLALPIDIYKMIFSDFCLYSMPYYKDFFTLDNFIQHEMNFSDKEILIFYKSLLEKVSEMHDNSLFSGDIWARNILMDENLDYRFIDFDYATTKNFLGTMANCGPLFLDFYNSKTLDSNYNIEQQIALSDKMALLSLILNCMLTGTFIATRELTLPPSFKKLEFPKSVNKKIRPMFESKRLVKTDDYFLEEIDALIKIDYKLPYRKKK